MRKQVFKFLLPLIQKVVHSLYKTNHRFEQGFWFLPTVKLSGYYDYIYIYRDLVTRITSPHFKRLEGKDEIYS
jgi:hypothetical protein